MAEVLYRYEAMKSHLSLILWSRRSTAKCSFEILASGPVKVAVRNPSPPERSLGSGMAFHVAAIAGLTPICRGSSGLHPSDPTVHRFPPPSSPLGCTVCPASGSPGPNVTALGFRLEATILPRRQGPPVSKPFASSGNSRTPARNAAVGTKREHAAGEK